jgi:hypothetical protein
LSQRFDAAQQQIDTLQAELAVTESRLLRIRSGSWVVPMAMTGTPRCLRLFMASAPS